MRRSREAVSRKNRRSGLQDNPNKNITLSEKDKKDIETETDIKVLKKWATSKTRRLRLKAALSQNTPKATIKRLQLDDDNQVAKAANTNPIMFESDFDKLMKLATSVKLPTRLSTAKNPNLTPKHIEILIQDIDHSVAKTVAKHQNINKEVMDRLLNAGGIHAGTYRAFFTNPEFQREWFSEWITSIPVEYADQYFDVLEDKTFVSNDDEFLEIYKIITREVEIKNSNFWYNFFEFPKYNYGEEVVLTILNDYGKLIWKDSPGTFDSITRLTTYNNNIGSKLYEISGHEDYLPQEAKDLFLF
jgi:hypothetical protein